MIWCTRRLVWNIWVPKTILYNQSECVSDEVTEQDPISLSNEGMILDLSTPEPVEHRELDFIPFET
jgi:hypothetical protein